jgi:two-component system OmpR family sensor kinase
VYAVESVASPSAAAFALHDAKNMLGVVSANVDYLDQEIAGGERTPAIDAALADLRESADRLGDLLREAIVALRGPGVKKADAATTRVAPIISSVVARSRRRADAAGVRIDVHLQGDPGSLIARDLLERILDNLLDNALRHSKAGDVIELTCTANPEGGGVVSVTDEGPGVPVVAREAIFSAYRARGTPDAGHFGLGLAFCRAVARAYGGDVRVQDAPHAGARFVLELA